MANIHDNATDKAVFRLYTKLKKVPFFILRAIWLIFEAQAILKSNHLAISPDDINAICSKNSQDTQIQKSRFFLSTLKPVVIKCAVVIKDTPGDDRRNHTV